MAIKPDFNQAEKIVTDTMQQTADSAQTLKKDLGAEHQAAKKSSTEQFKTTATVQIPTDDSSLPRPTPSQDSDPTNSLYEVGYVISTRNYLLLMNGLPTVRINEIVINQEGVRGLVTGLRENSVQVLLLDDAKISPNEQFFKTGQQLSVGAGWHLVSRVINPLGIPIDGKGKFPKPEQVLPADHVATGIKSRQFIKEQFITGVTTVDMLIPLAKGQRELVMGAARSGKSGFIIDTIVNQKATHAGNSPGKNSNGIIVVYAMIAKPLTEIRRIVDVLTVNKAIEYTCVIASSASDPASLIMVTPSVALSIAEFFQKQGKDVLLILDDMGLHAKYYREISLLSNKAPARESYPGDVFSIHAALVERAGKFNDQYGGGSITLLPVIETSFNDYASFIPTNLMAMTDGHLMFDYEIAHKGFRPALNVPLSVSRVGRQTQSIVAKQLADKVKSTMAQAKRLETLSRFGSEVSEETRTLLNQGQQIDEILAQSSLSFIPHPIQNILLALVYTDFLKGQNELFVKQNKAAIIDYLRKNLNLADFQQKASQMRSVDELIAATVSLIPQIQKVCVSTATPVPSPAQPTQQSVSTNP